MLGSERSALERSPAKPAEASPLQKESADWLSDNVLNPFLNGTGIRQIKDSFIGQDYMPLHMGSGKNILDRGVQTVSSIAGAMAPYIVLGKLSHCALGKAAEKFGAVGLTSKVLKSERVANVVGAGTYEFFKKPEAGQTRLGNTVGTVVSFSTFEAGNYLLPKSTIGIASKLRRNAALFAGRGAIGAIGGELSYESSNLVAGYTGGINSANNRDRWQAITTGAVLNEALPMVQEASSRSLDALAQRGLGLGKIEQNTHVGAANDAGQQPGRPWQATDTAQVVSRIRETGDHFPDVTDKALKARLETQLTQLSEKYNKSAAAEIDLDGLLNSFPEQDRPAALAVLSHSAPNSTESLFLKSLQSVAKQLAQQEIPADADNNANWWNHCLAKGAAGPGKVIGYIFNKLELKHEDRTNSKEINAAQPQATGIVLDDISTANYSPQELAALRDLKRMYVVDFNGFESGINFIDYALGADHVVSKVGNIIADIRHQSLLNTSLTQEDVQGYFQAKVDRAAGAIRPDSIVIRPALDSSAIAPDLPSLKNLLATPRASRQKFAEFLANYAPADREVAATVLNDHINYVDTPEMVARAKTLATRLQAAADERSPNSQMVFHEDNRDDSVAFANYLYRLANGIPRENFINSAALRAKVNESGDATVVFLDDAVYTGDSISGRIARSGVGEGGLIGTLAHFPSTNSLHNQQIYSAATQAEFKPVQIPTTDAQLTLARIGGMSGFSINDPNAIGFDSGFFPSQIRVNSPLLWPFSLPDNSIHILRLFGEQVLKLRNPCAKLDAMGKHPGNFW